MLDVDNWYMMPYLQIPVQSDRTASSPFSQRTAHSNLERMLHITHKVIDILNPDRQPYQILINPQRGPLLRGYRPMRHHRRVLRQTLHAAQRLRERKEPGGRQKALRLGTTSPDAECNHPAVGEAPVAVRIVRERGDEPTGVRGERCARDGVSWVGREAGVDHVRDVGRLLEGAGDSKGVFPVGLHAEVERLGAALGEPGVVGAWDGADGVLEEAEVGGEGGVVGGEDEGAHDDVRVAIDVFRDAVEDDVGAEEEGGRIVGRKECVVDEDKRV